MAQQTDLEVAVLNDKLKTLVAALTNIVAEGVTGATIDPAAEGRAAIRINRMNLLTARAALINTGFLPQ